MTVVILLNKLDSHFLSNTVRTELFERVHTDVWGPYRSKNHGNFSYFLTLIEDKSKDVWTYLFVDKSQVADLILAYNVNN